MCSKNKIMAVCLVHCLSCIYMETSGFELSHLNQPSNEVEKLNHRFKRDGGAIPFRPLFVYRQQQKEKQARWKLEEAQKLAHVQQQQFQSQNHYNSIIDYSKFSSNPTKGDYTYRRVPVYSSYQTTSPYQTNPTYQQYQNYQYYPVNSYEIDPTSPYRPYLTVGPLYADQQESYNDKYNSDYYS